jgi:hypothetical protein
MLVVAIGTLLSAYDAAQYDACRLRGGTFSTESVVVSEPRGCVKPRDIDRSAIARAVAASRPEQLSSPVIRRIASGGRRTVTAGLGRLAL